MSGLCNKCLVENCAYEPFSKECQSARIFSEEQSGAELNKRFLDTLDLECYLSQSGDVQETIDSIEQHYDGRDELPKELEGCVFNFLDTEDIAYYLADRYDKHVHEQVVHKYTLYK